ncbi:REP-associated tyrosine transposase [methane-oxidizing endosymbiont of Gigantopelta aegis]|uniref:REP-associated tyrosine transposase n=1 Tax=methane-oxidizing endosymbiont of Gigantopelta aegis TaxID=2794938 RepID=UPI0018DB3CD8|nr:transposase [methane-oxidizing endosymbiont of Gigantopelta aegis]
MGRSRYQITEADRPHFLTNTIINWIPVFTRPATVQIILDSLAYLQKNEGVKIYGYVILENHLHWIAQSPNLAKDVARFKAFTARQLVYCLAEAKQDKILQQFCFYKKKHKSDRQHQVWEEGSHPQLLQTEEMLRQKLDYIHQNPVKRGYVDKIEHWRYSSARNYLGMPGLIDVYRDW